MKFEFRFRPTYKKSPYQAAVWVRRTRSGTGCKISLGDDCGKLSATYEGGSDRQKTFEEKPESRPAKKIGEFSGKACDPAVVKAFQQAFEAGLLGQMDTSQRVG